MPLLWAFRSQEANRLGQSHYRKLNSVRQVVPSMRHGIEGGAECVAIDGLSPKQLLLIAGQLLGVSSFNEAPHLPIILLQMRTPDRFRGYQIVGGVLGDTPAVHGNNALSNACVRDALKG